MQAQSAQQSYEGRLELIGSEGEVLLVIRGIVQDVDAPVWAAESHEPLRRPAIGFDPAGDTVIVRLAEGTHLRSGDVAAAHVALSTTGHLKLAGSCAYHAPDSDNAYRSLGQRVRRRRMPGSETPPRPGAPSTL